MSGLDKLDIALKSLGKVEKNSNIYKPFKGHYSSIKDYYDGFIKGRLLDTESVNAWHKFWMDYTNEDSVTMFLRCANTAKNLKRGWMTRYKCEEKSFNVIFTDNDLAMIIYKLVLEGYVPDTSDKKDDLKKHLTEFKTKKELEWYSDKKELKGDDRKFLNFPVHFQNTEESEHEKNAAVISGPNCCLGRHGYKHSHIFDAGKKYYIKGTECGTADINNDYITIGDEKDYKYDKTINNFVRVVDLSKDEDRYKLLRKIARASTLRFLSPINYFLSPKIQNNIYSFNDHYSNDSAEFNVLLSYILKQRINFYDAETKDAMLISDEYYNELKNRYNSGNCDKFEIMYFGGEQKA